MQDDKIPIPYMQIDSIPVLLQPLGTTSVGKRGSADDVRPCRYECIESLQLPRGPRPITTNDGTPPDILFSQHSQHYFGMMTDPCVDSSSLDPAS